MRNYGYWMGLGLVIGLTGWSALGAEPDPAEVRQLMETYELEAEQKQQQYNSIVAAACEQRLLSIKIIIEAIKSARGSENDFTKLKDTRDRFDSILNAQKNEVPELRLFVEEIEIQWKPIKAEVDTILAGRESVVSVNNFVPLLESSLTQMSTLSDEIAKSMANSEVDSRQVYLATNQLQLIQRIESDLRRMLTEGGLSAAAADRFSRNVNLFGRVLKGMREGDTRLGVDRVNIPDSAGKLVELAELFKTIEIETTRIVDKALELIKVQSAVQRIIERNDTLFKSTSKLFYQCIINTE